MGTANRDLSGRSSSGFTLIEVVVTLIVMALVVTLAIPSFSKEHDARDSVTDVVRHSSRLAIRRAEWLTLRLDSRGTWDLRSDSQQDTTTTVASGAAVATEIVPFVVRISPMGACLTNGTPASDSGQNPCAAVMRAERPSSGHGTTPR